MDFKKQKLIEVMKKKKEEKQQVYEKRVKSWLHSLTMKKINEKIEKSKIDVDLLPF